MLKPKRPGIWLIPIAIFCSPGSGLHVSEAKGTPNSRPQWIRSIKFPAFGDNCFISVVYPLASIILFPFLVSTSNCPCPHLMLNSYVLLAEEETRQNVLSGRMTSSAQGPSSHSYSTHLDYLDQETWPEPNILSHLDHDQGTFGNWGWTYDLNRKPSYSR